MTSVVLLEQLKAFTEKIMADMILPVAMQQGDTEQAYRAPEVYLMRLPDSRAAKFLSTPSARRATAKTETKSLFSNKLYNILHEFRRALIYNGSKSYPNHAK